MSVTQNTWKGFYFHCLCLPWTFLTFVRLMTSALRVVFAKFLYVFDSNIKFNENSKQITSKLFFFLSLSYLSILKASIVISQPPSSWILFINELYQVSRNSSQWSKKAEVLLSLLFFFPPVSYRVSLVSDIILQGVINKFCHCTALVWRLFVLIRCLYMSMYVYQLSLIQSERK